MAYNSPSSIKGSDSSESFHLKYTVPGEYSFVLQPGKYKVTCYGAQGGDSILGASGGRGAFVSGYLNINEYDQTFFVRVGGKGGTEKYGLSPGGYNGGGQSGWCIKYKHHWHHKQFGHGGGGGGGATELRIKTNTLANRIIVAAGGSGASYEISGAPGGDLNGYNGRGVSTRTNQVLGNENGVGSAGIKAKKFPSSGGGAGYRGGAVGFASDSDQIGAVSDSGSSYISGFPGCAVHSMIELTSCEMKAGIQVGNGLFEIEQDFSCPEKCNVCAGPHQCKSCDQQYRLFDGLCYESCPEGSIDQITYCEKCDDSCLACSDIPTNCTSCREDDYFYNGQCIQKCPSGTFEFGKECKDKCPSGTFSQNSNCEQCDIACSECVDKPSKCTDCPEGKYLFNNECIDKCPDRSVREGNKCLTECSADQYLYNDICYKQCPIGTYAKGIICEECRHPCVECRSDASTCTKCSSNTYLFNSKCDDKCPDGFYTYNNKCVDKCPSDTFVHGIECVDVCPFGKYGINHACKDCDSSCEWCENSSTLCTKCNKDTYLFNYQCIKQCPNNTFIYQNECVTKCPSGFYPYENVCQEGEEYYSNAEKLKRQPKISKTVTIVVLTFLIAIFVAIIAILVWMFIHKNNNNFFAIN